MGRETFVDKMAKASFESEVVQKQWAGHYRVFGPIMEPAFVGNDQAKVHLTAALNKISQRDSKGGQAKLKGLKKFCVTDADNAAWLFFMGVSYEMAGDRKKMADYYRESCELGHRFYMPYVKLARYEYDNSQYELAEEYYRKGIGCLEESVFDQFVRIALASAYTNLGACLMMLYRYEEAENIFDYSEEILPNQAGRSASRAMLCAVQGDRAGAESYLVKTAAEAPMILEQTRAVVEEIFAGTHPHFCQRK